MKKYLFTSAFAVILAFTGCSKDEVVTPKVPTGKYELTITVSNEGTDGSRAGSSDAGVMTWETGDEIGVFVGTEKNVRFTMVSDNGSLATFRGLLRDEPAAGSTYYAYYPYAPAATMNGNNMNINMQTAQTYTNSDEVKFHELPMVGKYTGDATDVHFDFKNLFTVIRFTAQAPANDIIVSSLSFQSLGNEIVAGNFSVDMSGATFTPSISTTGINRVGLICPGGVTIPAGTTANFYIAVPSINYASGYSITYYTSLGSQTAQKASAEDFSTKQNIIFRTPTYPLNNLDLQNVNADISDSNFKRYLLDNGYITTSTGDVNGQVTGFTQKASQEVLLQIPSDATVHNLNILRYFPNLQTLIVENNQVSNVDLSVLPSISAVTLKGNFLNSVNLAYNTGLKILELSNNQNLNSVDLSKCPNLQVLDIDGINGLQSLDLSHNSELVSLSCYGNSNMQTLNISGCSKLTTLHLNNATTNEITPATENTAGVLNLATTPQSLKNIYADNILGQYRTWSSVEVTNNNNLQVLSLQNNTGLAGINATGSNNITVYVYNSIGANVTPPEKGNNNPRQ